MTYLVIELQTNAEGSVANIVTAYTDRNQAESKYHLILTSAAVSSVPTHAAAIFTNEGQLLERHVYHHAIPEVEPEVEPEENGEA